MNPRLGEKEHVLILNVPRHEYSGIIETERVMQAKLSSGMFDNASLRNALVYL